MLKNLDSADGAMACGIIAMVLVISVVAACDMPAARSDGDKAEGWYTMERTSIAFDRYHDNEMKVTCWRMGSQGTHCMRDAELGRKP